jgi:hypothetical protein
VADDASERSERIGSVSQDQAPTTKAELAARGPCPARNGIFPAIGEIGVHELRPSGVARTLDKIADERGLVMADQTLAYLVAIRRQSLSLLNMRSMRLRRLQARSSYLAGPFRPDRPECRVRCRDLPELHETNRCHLRV